MKLQPELCVFGRLIIELSTRYEQPIIELQAWIKSGMLLVAEILVHPESPLQSHAKGTGYLIGHCIEVGGLADVLISHIHK